MKDLISDKKILVVGAGLAGLNCARILRSSGYEVVVIESKDQVGGRVATDVIDGFYLDHGFQVVNPAYTELRKTGLGDQLEIAVLPKGVELIYDGKIKRVGDPFRDWRYVSADLAPSSGRISEKLRFVKYLFSTPKEQAFGEVFKSNSRFYAKVLKPFLTGVFLTNPDEVSSLMAHELLYWFRKGQPGVPKMGIRALPLALAEGLDIKLNTTATGLGAGVVKTSSGDLKADVVVLATNQKQAATLLGRGKWSTNGSTTWYHSIPAGSLSSKHLRIDPSSELVNSIVLSNVAPSYAPAGKALISTTTLETMKEGDVRKRISKLWNLPESKFEFIKSYEIPESLPKHTPGKPLLSTLKITPQLYAIGDYQAVPSQQGALLTGRIAAEEIMRSN